MHILDLDGASVINPNLTLLSELIMSDFTRPAHIMDSSVGEYYANNMSFFIQTYHKVKEHLESQGHKNPLATWVAQSLLPIGTQLNALKIDMVAEDVVPNARTLEVLAGPVTNQILEPLVPGNVWDVATVKKQMQAVEKVGQRLCAGYTPQRDVGRTTFIQNDSGFYTEYLLANLIYPWVMQPMNQLRLLIPSIDKEVWDNMLKEYMNPASEDNMALRSGLDFGQALTYEFVSDFQAYMSFRQANPPFQVNLQRQIWTPFFGINNAEQYEIYIKDEALLDEILKCYTQSKKLYVEMLKTGLAYESQFAVLMGFSGRFMINSSLGGLLGLTHTDVTRTFCPSALDLDMDIVTTGYLGKDMMFSNRVMGGVD